MLNVVCKECGEDTPLSKTVSNEFGESTCRQCLAAMKKCKHCWHIKGISTYGGATEICCHCGEIKEPESSMHGPYDPHRQFRAWNRDGWTDGKMGVGGGDNTPLGIINHDQWP